MDMPFNVVAVDPTDPRVVYAGSDVGLWRSVDAAATWVRMGPDTGLPHAPIYDIKINPTTNGRSSSRMDGAPLCSNLRLCQGSLPGMRPPHCLLVSADTFRGSTFRGKAV